MSAPRAPTTPAVSGASPRSARPRTAVTCHVEADQAGQRQGYRRVAADYGRFRSDLEQAGGEIDRGRLLQALGDYFDANGIEGDWDAIEEAENEALVTSLAMICPFAAPEKQALLEAMTLPDRAEAMTAIMEMSAHDGGDDERAARH